jgi:hypothetical protein
MSRAERRIASQQAELKRQAEIRIAAQHERDKARAEKVLVSAWKRVSARLFQLIRHGDTDGVQQLLAGQNDDEDVATISMLEAAHAVTAARVWRRHSSQSLRNPVARLLRMREHDFNDDSKQEGLSAIGLACELGFSSVLRVLLASDNGSADPNLLNGDGSSALALALKYRHVLCVAQLVVHPMCFINTGRGMVDSLLPLTYAVLHNQVEIVHLLLGSQRLSVSSLQDAYDTCHASRPNMSQLVLAAKNAHHESELLHDPFVVRIPSELKAAAAGDASAALLRVRRTFKPIFDAASRTERQEVATLEAAETQSTLRNAMQVPLSQLDVPLAATTAAVAAAAAAAADSKADCVARVSLREANRIHQLRQLAMRYPNMKDVIERLVGIRLPSNLKHPIEQKMSFEPFDFDDSVATAQQQQQEQQLNAKALSAALRSEIMQALRGMTRADDDDAKHNARFAPGLQHTTVDFLSRLHKGFECPHCNDALCIAHHKQRELEQRFQHNVAHRATLRLRSLYKGIPMRRLHNTGALIGQPMQSSSVLRGHRSDKGGNKPLRAIARNASMEDFSELPEQRRRRLAQEQRENAWFLDCLFVDPVPDDSSTSQDLAARTLQHTIEQFMSDA